MPNWFNPTISVGNIMIWLTWLVTAVLAYGQLDKINAVQDARISDNRSQLGDDKDELNKDMDFMRHQIELINAKLDRLVQEQSERDLLFNPHCFARTYQISLARIVQVKSCGLRILSP